MDVTDNEMLPILQPELTRQFTKERKCVRTLQIYVMCEKLKNLDGIRNKTDSQVTLNMKWQQTQEGWTEIDRTEVIADNLNPQFARCFNVIYNFGQMVKLQFVVHDIDASKKTTLGLVEVSLSDLMSKAFDNRFTLPLTGAIKDAGFLTIIVTENAKAKYQVNLALKASGLPSQNSFWSMNFATTYVLEFYKGARGNNAKVYESEWFTNDPNHTFEEIKLTDSQLCDNNNSDIEIKIINRNQFTMMNKEVCHAITNLQDLQTHKRLCLVNALGARVADLLIDSCSVQPIP